MTSARTSDHSVDWAALRRRLDEAIAALGREGQLDAETRRSILAQRAAKLAQPRIPDSTADTCQVVIFKLGSETCAMDAELVLNVFRLGGLALLPGAPAAVHGVTMWRGEVLTLLDLRGLLGMSTAALTDLGRVIVVGRTRAAFGFLADSVHGVRVISRNDVHASRAPAGTRAGLVKGITSDALLVLDGKEVLSLATTGA